MMAFYSEIMSKEIKCYCGHTKTCDCGKKVETALDWFNNKLDDILELYPSEWDEIQKVFIEAKKRELEEIQTIYKNGKDEGYDQSRMERYL